jgi:hypothetical protein
MSQIGPRIPSNPSPGQGDNEESSDDDYGPALPPSIAAARAQLSSSGSAPRARTVMGPALPSALTLEDSDSDDVGPSPLPASTSRQDGNDGVNAFLEAEERRKKGLQVNHIVYRTSSNIVLMASRVNLIPRLLSGKNGC